MSFYIIIVILLFVIYGSFSLSKHDYKKKDVCPKVLGIPACYLVLLFFIGALIIHLILPVHTYLYFAMLVVPFLLALTGTMTELSGKVICPRTPGGIPMCYISLGFCMALIGLKFFSF